MPHVRIGIVLHWIDPDLGRLLSIAAFAASILAFSIVPRILRRRGRRRWYRYEQRRCSGCGYDIRASRDRCPECGADLPQQARAYWRQRLGP